MKKKNFKNLALKKKSISNLQNASVKGGNSVLCTGLFGSCWCDVTVTDCFCPKK